MRFFLFFLLALVECFGTSLKSFNLYCIGNSLTWGAKPGLLEYPFSDLGYDLTVDYHIACGKSLNFILNNPESTCVDSVSGDNWIERLSSEAIEFDAVVFQAHLGASLGEELSAISRMIAIATEGGRNLSTNFYILYTWPRNLPNLKADVVWSEELESNIGVGTDAGMEMKNSLAQFDFLLSEIRLLYPNLTINAIPTGLVLFGLAEQLKLGDASTSMSDFYADTIHLKWASGEFISHLVLAATLLRVEPSDLNLYSNWENAIDIDFLTLSKEVTASVLDNTFRTDIYFPPKMEYVLDKLYFRGQLLQSDNLIDWYSVDTVISPIHFKSFMENHKCLFFTLKTDFN